MQTTMPASAGSSRCSACKRCGNQFTKPDLLNQHSRVYCSDACAKAQRSEDKRPCRFEGCLRLGYGRDICEHHRNLSRFGKPCSTCGAMCLGERCRGCRCPAPAAPRSQLPVPTQCGDCGELYLPSDRRRRRHCYSHHSKNGLPSTYVPKTERWVKCIKCAGLVWSRIDRVRCEACKLISRREYKREAKHARRARMRAVEFVGIRYLIQRDRGRCQLCGKKVDATKSVPHPLAPTTDHIVPLDPKAGEGRHERRNCQLAHFECNWRKGNRGTDQLRLFG